MARSGSLHDHPRSPKSDEKREAKKGDVRTGKELVGEDGADDEYESIGKNPESTFKDDPEAGSAEEHKDALRDWKKWGGRGKGGADDIRHDSRRRGDVAPPPRLPRVVIMNWIDRVVAQAGGLIEASRIHGEFARAA